MLHSLLRQSALITLAALGLASLATACASEDAGRASPVPPPATAAPGEPGASPEQARSRKLAEWLGQVPAIVDPENLGWPRTIMNGETPLTFDRPPLRVHTLSLGHDEIIVALAGPGRLAGIGSFTADPVYSNVALQVTDLPKVKRDAEAVLGLKPDLVIASKFTSRDLIDRIRGAGVPVVQTSLENSALGNEPNIALLGYILGAEEQAFNLASEVRSRMAAVTARLGASGQSPKARSLSVARFADTIDAAGKDSTEGGIIESAGGVNVAAEAGVAGHAAVSLEAIAAMRPDVIFLTQPEDSATKLREELLTAPALAEVPAIRDRRILIGDPRYFTTLSHWNVRGTEEAARALYPAAFAGIPFTDFAPQPGAGARP
jgi:iron complex transport system substrate-binding protein